MSDMSDMADEETSAPDSSQTPSTSDGWPDDVYKVVDQQGTSEPVRETVEPASTISVPFDKAKAAGLPPDQGPEVDVITVRPAMFRAHPLIYAAVTFIGLLGFVLMIWKGIWPLSWAWLIFGFVIMMIAIGFLGVWKIKTLGVSLRITNKRTVVIIGLFSRATSEVVHDNIRNIQVTQSFMERVFGVGRLGLSSSGQDGVEIDVPNIPNPERVREIIDKYRPL